TLHGMVREAQHSVSYIGPYGAAGATCKDKLAGVAVAQGQEHSRRQSKPTACNFMLIHMRRGASLAYTGGTHSDSCGRTTGISRVISDSSSVTPSEFSSVFSMADPPGVS